MKHGLHGLYVVCSFKWIHITILKVIYNARLVVAEAQTRIVYDGIVCMIATTRRVQCRAKVARFVCPTILYFLLGLVTLQLLLLTLLIPSSFSTLPPFSLSLRPSPLSYRLSIVNLIVFIILLPYSKRCYFMSTNCTNEM